MSAVIMSRPEFYQSEENGIPHLQPYSPEEVTMPPGRPPISTTTRLYGHFAHATVARSLPLAVIANALLDQRGVDAP